MNEEFYEHLLTEEEVRQRMSEIAQNYPTQRRALREAYEGLSKADAKAHLAIKFGLVAQLKHPDVIALVEASHADPKAKITESDKDALKTLELEDQQTKYDLAKFDCETSDKEYGKLEAILSYFQSVMKFQGPTVKDARTPW